MSAEATIWFAALCPALIVAGGAFLIIHIAELRSRKGA